MEINICEMTLIDLNSISNILCDEFDDFWTYNTLKSELTSNYSKYFIAKIGENTVGFAGLKIILDEAELMNIVVRKSYRGNGISSLLLNYLLIYVHNLNVNTIHLEVAKNNTIAIHLYENFGFQKIGFRDKYYGTQGAILMKLTL